MACVKKPHMYIIHHRRNKYHEKKLFMQQKFVILPLYLDSYLERNPVPTAEQELQIFDELIACLLSSQWGTLINNLGAKMSLL